MTEAAARRGALFDVGYTLMDEWPRVAAAAEWFAKRLRRIGVRTSPAALEQLYGEACRHPRRMNALVQTLVDLGIDEETAWAVRGDLPWDRVPLEPYPDALPALRRLRAAGLRVGVLANQPASAGRDLERAGLAALADGVWLSEEAGLAKPDPAFFALALKAWGLQPPSVAYVGDRPDADVRPAGGLGMYTVRVLRGPHANQKPRDRTERADVEVPTLQEAARRLLAWAGQPVPRGPEHYNAGFINRNGRTENDLRTIHRGDAEPFGPEPFGPEPLTAEGLTAEGGAEKNGMSRGDGRMTTNGH